MTTRAMFLLLSIFVSCLGASRTHAASAGVLSLASATYATTQDAGSFTVSVKRSGGSSGIATIYLQTLENTATYALDYNGINTLLQWSDGDSSSRSVTIKLRTPAAYKGSRELGVHLHTPTGAALGGISLAAVTIKGSEPVVAPPADTSAAMGPTAASRLLNQATFGATLDSISTASSQSYNSWFAAQAALPASLYTASVPNDQTNWFQLWLTNAVMSKDQLRQRMAFALSEIVVLSNNGGALIDQNKSVAAFYDILVKNALGNYRTLLEQVTLSTQMGQWLSMFRNDKPNPALNIHADENYAREVMQLFTVGTVQLNLDGSVKKNSAGVGLPTFVQSNVTDLARVFTGWASTPTTHPFGEQSWLYDLDYYAPMQPYAQHHDEAAKTIVGNITIGANGSAASDLEAALNGIFSHPNMGPFIGKQLIQRLVTSDPSPAYVSRVAAVFNNNGSGVRGDLLAVAKAILTDVEAVNVSATGKLREPLLREINLWRAFNAADSAGRIEEYLVIQNAMQTFAEAPLSSPSVFNFFRPDYQRAGPLTDAGLVVPEFQITNENTLVLTSNQLLSSSYAFVDSKGAKHNGYQGYSETSALSPTSVLLKTAEWEAFAATPATLVAKLNLVLMQGNMPTAMQNSLVNYLTAVPANVPWYRVAEAAEIVVASPQYSVQR